MTDVYLSIYILQSDDGNGAYLAFLVAARDENDAQDISDTFVSEIEVIADPTSTRRAVEEARSNVEVMQPDICLIEDDTELAYVARALRAHNPNFEQELVSYIGGVFTVQVSVQSGFPSEAAKALRGRLVKHRVINSLSVDLV